MFARYEGTAYTLTGVNTSDTDQTVPFWFPIAGDYLEELHGGSLNLNNVPASNEVVLTIPSHYGRIWTSQEFGTLPFRRAGGIPPSSHRA